MNSMERYIFFYICAQSIYPKIYNIECNSKVFSKQSACIELHSALRVILLRFT